MKTQGLITHTIQTFIALVKWQEIVVAIMIKHLQVYATYAQHICCPSGNGKEVWAYKYKPSITYESDKYCTGMVLGIDCRINEPCESGTCMNGTYN